MFLARLGSLIVLLHLLLLGGCEPKEGPATPPDASVAPSEPIEVNDGGVSTPDAATSAISQPRETTGTEPVPVITVVFPGPRPLDAGGGESSNDVSWDAATAESDTATENGTATGSDAPTEDAAVPATSTDVVTGDTDTTTAGSSTESSCSPGDGCLTTPPAPPVNQGDSVGARHLRTFDGVKYDFPAAGEFVLTRDERDGFEVQTRTTPLSDAGVPVTTAVALRVGRDLLGFYADGATRLNGAAHAFTEGYNRLPAGAEVWRSSSTFVVVWADHSQVSLELGASIAVHVFVANSRAPHGETRLVGLLGDFDGITGNDLVTAGGLVLDDPAPFTTFFGVFAESWRVTDGDSLFDYAPGEATETFTDRAFPAALATLDGVTEDALATASDSCASVGLEDAWFAACRRDVALTGDTSLTAGFGRAAPVLTEFTFEPPSDLCDVPGDRMCVEGNAHEVDGCTGAASLLETCSAERPCQSGFCLDETSAALRGLVTDAASGEPLAGVRVVVKREGVATASLETGATGLYALALNPGLYQLLFSAPGYLEVTMTVEAIAGEVTTVTGLRQVPAQGTAPGAVEGVIRDAIDGLGVAVARVELRRGINDTSGEVLAAGVTDGSGTYRIEGLPPGNYTASVLAENYTPATFDVVVISGVSTPNQGTSIAPLLPVGELQMVLTWQSEPRDLDSHLYTPSIDGVAYHISYEFTGSELTPPYAALDVDDTSGYGPETLTIKQAVSGTYLYRVHNYSRSPALAGCGARVDVYDHTGLAKSFVVPTSGDGLWWDVFSFDGDTGVITPLNTIATE